jgi:hypothetical protein
MRSVDSNTQNYLTARDGVITRRFVWIIAKNRTTGAEEPAGFWNGEYAIDVEVVSGQSGLPETRTYEGAGSLLTVDDINLVSDLTIQTLRVKLSQTNAAVNNAIRWRGRGSCFPHSRIDHYQPGEEIRRNAKIAWW